ncbi:MAG: M48 family metallopeptidase [Candidatus Omnitrophica bacterium]|nr:M48 family metallopeptidase [Candidatus Omnitrophota bacterium]
MGKYIMCIVCIFLIGCASQKNGEYFKEISAQDMKELEYAALVEEKLYTQFNVTAAHSETMRLNEIAKELKDVSHRPYWPSNVLVITDPGYINACTGGRDIYVGEGLLNILETDDERAYVIAHELAHIDNSHPMKSFESSQHVGFFRKIGGYIASIFFAFLPAGSVHPAVSITAQNSIAMVNQVASDIIYKGYKRSFEIEADEDALIMMRTAGFKSVGALTVLTKLEKSTKSSAGGVLSDHPAYDDRIDDMQKLIENTAL